MKIDVLKEDLSNAEHEYKKFYHSMLELFIDNAAAQCLIEHMDDLVKEYIEAMRQVYRYGMDPEELK